MDEQRYSMQDIEMQDPMLSKSSILEVSSLTVRRDMELANIKASYDD
jgi:hypothetical protein